MRTLLAILLSLPTLALAQFRPLTLQRPHSTVAFTLDGGGQVDILAGRTLVNNASVSYNGSALTYSGTLPATDVAYNADMAWPATYWIRFRQTGRNGSQSGGYCHVINRRDSTVSGDNPRWELTAATNATFDAGFVVVDSAGTVAAVYGGARQLGEWVTVVFSFEPATKTLYLFDGAFASTTQTNFNGNYAANDKLSISGYRGSGSAPTGISRQLTGDVSAFGYIAGVVLKTQQELGALWVRISGGSAP
jgi:hypothetical protein